MTKKLVFLSIFFLGIFFLSKAFFFVEKASFVTVKIQGGIGNSLFQTAVGACYAKKYQLQFVVPKKYLSSKTNRKILHRLNFKKKIFPQELFKEDHAYAFQPLPKKKNVLLEGFFISKKYFEKEQKWLQKLFAPSGKIKGYLQRKYHRVLSHPMSVGLHIRTYYPDYLSQGFAVYKTYPAPDLDYIQKAIEYFPRNSLFIVCSDNIAWCKKNLKRFNRTFFFVENEKNYHDFYLLTLCKHLILSNSTFSWWAAFLNTLPNKKVIYRTPWIYQFNYKEEDLFFEDWIKIEGQKEIPLPVFD